MKTLEDLPSLGRLLTPCFRFTRQDEDHVDFIKENVTKRKFVVCGNSESYPCWVRTTQGQWEDYASTSRGILVSHPRYRQFVPKIDELFFTCRQARLRNAKVVLVEKTINLNEALTAAPVNPPEVLLYEGVQDYSVLSASNTPKPKWLSSIAGNTGQCYTCWDVEDNDWIPVRKIDLDIGTVFMGPRGRSVSYSLVWDYDRKGPAGIETDIIASWFSLEREVEGEQWLLKYGIKVFWGYSENMKAPREPSIPPEYADLRPLAMRARANFLRNCQSVCPQIEDQRLKYLEQANKVSEDNFDITCPEKNWFCNQKARVATDTLTLLEAEKSFPSSLNDKISAEIGRQINELKGNPSSWKGFSYRKLLWALSWQEGLATIQEEWQLAIYLEVIFQKLWEGDPDLTIPGEPLMQTCELLECILEQSELPAQRKEEIKKMGESFVARYDPNWNPHPRVPDGY